MRDFRLSATWDVISMPSVPKLNMKMANGMFGDWEVVGRWLNEKHKTFTDWGDEPMIKCAELYLKTIKQGIESQSFDWPPLSKQYLKMKIKAGYGTNILINTRSYLNGIVMTEMVKKKKTRSIFVGANPNAMHEPSGLPMSYIGAIHEYGTRNGRIPARPHYRPAWQSCRHTCRNIWLRHFRTWGRVK